MTFQIERPNGERVDVPDDMFRFWKRTFKDLDNLRKRMDGTSVDENTHLLETLDKLIIDHVEMIREKCEGHPAGKRPMLAYLQGLEAKEEKSPVTELVLNRVKETFELIEKFKAADKQDKKSLRLALVRRKVL